MGKNTNKPVHKSQMSSGGGGEVAEEERPFHSKEYEQAQLNALLAGSSRPSWDEFKEQRRKKGELEGAEERLEEEAQRKFRMELDEARNQRLGAAEASAEAEAGGGKKKKHKHKHKHKSDKHKSEKSEKKKKRRREDDSGSSDDSDSDSEEEAKRKKKRKHKHKSEKSDKGGKADGPVSLKAFFAEGSSDED